MENNKAFDFFMSRIKKEEPVDETIKKIVVKDFGPYAPAVKKLVEDILKSCDADDKIKVVETDESDTQKFNIMQIIVPIKNEGNHHYKTGKPYCISRIYDQNGARFYATDENGEEKNVLMQDECRAATEGEIRSFADKMTWEYVYIAPKKTKAS